jgi:hypothetical protein
VYRAWRETMATSGGCGAEFGGRGVDSSPVVILRWCYVAEKRMRWWGKRGFKNCKCRSVPKIYQSSECIFRGRWHFTVSGSGQNKWPKTI